jgi:hypothetical protein
MAIFQVAGQLLPAAVTGLVMAAIMAAIMSTADSLLLQTGSIASRDIYERFINPGASERQMVMVSRGLVVAVALVGYVVALVEPPTVFSIVIFATSVLGSAFLPAYVCAVWWKKARQYDTVASDVNRCRRLDDHDDRSESRNTEDLAGAAAHRGRHERLLTGWTDSGAFSRFNGFRAGERSRGD